MRVPLDLPQIALVRVETAGGPYRPGDRLSLAFVVPTVGRVVAHDGDDAGRPDVATLDGVVPETVTVVVETAATPYARDERLTLAFVDPRVARIHPFSEPVPEPIFAPVRAHEGVRAGTVRVPPPPASPSAPEMSRNRVPTVATRSHDERAQEDVAGNVHAEDPTEATRPGEPARGVVVRLAWTPERVRRFIQVVDKLFTVDRLGWYRHALAMRLLVPDDVACGDALGDVEAMRHMHALRAAAVETLGRPMLAAFMPNFSVSPEWLASLDSAHAARAVVGLRDALFPFATDAEPSLAPQSGFSVRAIRRSEVERSVASVEGCIATLVPTSSTNVALTDCLEAYRSTLVDAFGQTARAAEAVRVNGMTQPNHSLDDRLWRLVGAVGEAFDGLAVA